MFNYTVFIGTSLQHDFVEYSRGSFKTFLKKFTTSSDSFKNGLGPEPPDGSRCPPGPDIQVAYMSCISDQHIHLHEFTHTPAFTSILRHLRCL